MNKKTLGFIIAILLIGSMVVIMVKSNLDKPKPIDEFLIGADFSALDEEPGLEKGQFHLTLNCRRFLVMW